MAWDHDVNAGYSRSRPPPVFARCPFSRSTSTSTGGHGPCSRFPSSGLRRERPHQTNRIITVVPCRCWHLIKTPCNKAKHPKRQKRSWPTGRAGHSRRPARRRTTGAAPARHLPAGPQRHRLPAQRHHAPAAGDRRLTARHQVRCAPPPGRRRGPPQNAALPCALKSRLQGPGQGHFGRAQRRRLRQLRHRRNGEAAAQHR